MITLSIILLAGWLLGGLLALQFRPAGDWPTGDTEALPPAAWLFGALALGLALLGWLALTLAELGHFAWPWLGGGWLAAVLALGLRRHTRLTLRHLHTTWHWPPPGRDHLEYLLLAGWLVAAGWLFFRPHQAIQGAADAGVYVNMAANIAHTGSILYDDPSVANLDPNLYAVFLRPRQPGEGTGYYLFPGFNVADDIPASQVIPDFYPLHPVWQAVAYQLGGVMAALRMPGLWALLGCLAVYLALRQASSWPVAMLGLAGMSLNALQVWFARYPVTETLTQFLLWTSLWAYGAWLSRRRAAPLWGLLAGLTLGQLLLVRIDTLFMLALPLLTAAGWLLAKLPGRGPKAWRLLGWYLLPVALLTLQGGLHAIFLSAPYATRVFDYARRTITRLDPTAALLMLAGLLVIVVGLLIIRFARSAGQPRPGSRSWGQRWANYRRPILASLTLLVLALTFYGWFLRPALGQTGSYTDWYGGGTIIVSDHENLVRLGWYLSPLGVWLGAAGICLLLWRANRRTVAILGTGLFFALLYLWRIQNNPHQIYAMRRYVPAVMPFFVFAGAYFVGWLWPLAARWPRPGHAQTLLRLAIAGLAALWLAGFAWSARGFISQVDYPTLVQDLAALNNQLGPEAVLIFNDQAAVSLGDVLGTPLHYLHGQTALTLRNPAGISDTDLASTLRQWQRAGHTVYWIGDPAFLDRQQWAYSSQTVLIPAHFLETPYDHKPTAINELWWTVNLHKLAP